MLIQQTINALLAHYQNVNNVKIILLAKLVQQAII